MAHRFADDMGLRLTVQGSTLDIVPKRQAGSAASGATSDSLKDYLEASKPVDQQSVVKPNLGLTVFGRFNAL